MSDQLIHFDSSGQAHIVWEDYRGANADVYGQKLDTSGTALWSERFTLEVLTPPSTWTAKILISSTSNTLYSYTLTTSEFNGGSPSIRFEDASGFGGGARRAASFPNRAIRGSWRPLGRKRITSMSTRP